ncbi:rhoptry kinase family protein ROP35 [Besnoitia besnoiti]|uniref:non-specific serine/threonine protein kinase n=1 Tax=Besnoitia besnoiti TaxID=94643 RepID=A0A2A9MID7_BESBE|nr:rhoptry kinase family protein ROP35 [Besnoitia besnoiti]PFH36021.1 rhoptry kinase family protein ROP35 [Besnoitia besnoiti]
MEHMGRRPRWRWAVRAAAFFGALYAVGRGVSVATDTRADSSSLRPSSSSAASSPVPGAPPLRAPSQVVRLSSLASPSKLHPRSSTDSGVSSPDPSPSPEHPVDPSPSGASPEAEDPTASRSRDSHPEAAALLDYALSVLSSSPSVDHSQEELLGNDGGGVSSGASPSFGRPIDSSESDLWAAVGDFVDELQSVTESTFASAVAGLGWMNPEDEEDMETREDKGEAEGDESKALVATADSPLLASPGAERAIREQRSGALQRRLGEGEEAMTGPRNDFQAVELRVGHGDGGLSRRAPVPRWVNILALTIGLAASAFGYSAYKHGGAWAAIRIHRLQFKKKLPWSWKRFLDKLPVLEESKFEEFEDIVPWLKRGVRIVKRVPQVSEQLADFLKLDEDVRKTGIVIKVKATKGVQARRLAYEINAHLNMVPKNPFILPLLGAFKGASRRAVYLILPRARCDVADYLKARPYDVDLRLAAAEMTYALNVLHEHGFLHRDIKAHNYFVGFDNHVLLADFEGVGVLQQRAAVVGTYGYFAPELSSPTDHTERTDIYALGQTFRRMLRYLGPGIKVPKVREFWSLAKRMIADDPMERPTMKEIMNDRYFAGIDFGRLELKDQGVPFRGNYTVNEAAASGRIAPAPLSRNQNQ